MDAIKNDSYATYMAGVPRLIKAGVDRGDISQSLGHDFLN